MSNFYANPNPSQIRNTGSALTDLNGQGLDLESERSTLLAWTETHGKVIINASSDFTQLSGIRGALLKLKEEFFTGGQEESIIIQGDRRELF